MNGGRRRLAVAVRVRAGHLPARLAARWARSVVRRGGPSRIRVRVPDGTVRSLPVERYVAGVVAAECRADWPGEVHRAVAVCARSYALARFSTPTTWRRHHHVVAGRVDQHLLTRGVDPLFDDAASSTVGLTLVGTDGPAAGLPAAAHYHNACGGTTDAAVDVWPPPGTRRCPDDDQRSRVACPVCREEPGRWTTAFAHRLFAHLVRLPGVGRSVEVDEIVATSTGRVVGIGFRSGDRTVSVTGEQLRVMCGPDRLKSARFDVSVDHSAVRFSGRGHGHGVGLCKRGAVGLAARGWTAERILAHFHPGLELTAAPGQWRGA